MKASRLVAANNANSTPTPLSQWKELCEMRNL